MCILIWGDITRRMSTCYEKIKKYMICYLTKIGIVQGNVPTMDGAAIQRFLIRGARRPGTYSYPNEIWGFGLLDLYGSFQAMRGIRTNT